MAESSTTSARNVDKHRDTLLRSESIMKLPLRIRSVLLVSIGLLAGCGGGGGGWSGGGGGFGAVYKAVDQRLEKVVAEDLGPLGDGFVGGQDQAGALVAMGDDLEEVVGLATGQGQVADFVHDEQRRPLVTVSAGNHGQGVALAGKQIGTRVIVFVAEHAVPSKLEAIRGFGADIRLVPGGYGDAEKTAHEYADLIGANWISRKPFT